MANDPAAYRLGFPAWMGFIYGLDISQYILSVNITQHDGNAPNTCQITLNNELDIFTVTTNDIIYLDRFKSGLDSRKLSVPWLTSDMDPGITDTDPDTVNLNIADVRTSPPGLMHPIKKAILGRKGKLTQTVSKDDRVDAFNQPLPNFMNDYFGQTILEYPISDGCSVFHVMDPVRMFFRDPFDPSSWYHMFCGFVSDITENVDQNNVKTVTILVEDPTKLFRYTRVALNPGVVDAKKVVQDQDIRIQSFWTNPFVDMTLPEIIYTIIFGPTYKNNSGNDVLISQKFSEIADSVGGVSILASKMRGIGHFSWDKSLLATVGPASDDQSNSSTNNKSVDIGVAAKPLMNLGTNLAFWQRLLDHKVSPSDIYMMATDKDSGSNTTMYERRGLLTRDIDGNIDIVSVINLIGGHPELYPVDGGRMMMLIPLGMGTQNNEIVIKDVIQSYALQTNFIPIGQMIMEIVNRIEFSFYCTPRGDIVIEPPLCDFLPSDFGMQTIKSDSIINHNIIGVTGSVAAYYDLGKALQIFNSPDSGPYGPNYVILKRDTYSWESAQIDEKVFTMAAGVNALIKNFDNIGYSDMIGKLQTVTIPELIPLYGVRQASLTPRGYISTPQAANLYAQICLNRLNSDAHSVHINHIPNIKMWINRPTYVQGRNLLATTRQINHSITWGQQGDMSTTSELNYVRTWSGEVDKFGQMIYTTIGGHGAKLFDYAMLFQMAPKPEVVEPISATIAPGQFEQLQIPNALTQKGTKALQTEINQSAVDNISNILGYR